MSEADSEIEGSEELSRWARLALVLGGLLALPLLFYIGIFALFAALDGHGSSTMDNTELATRAVVLAVPLLLLALIILSWTCTTRRRLAVLAVVGGALAADVALALYLI